MDRDDHAHSNGIPSPRFPSLPILSQTEVRRSTRERYGGLFYLGVIGLGVIVTFLSWFGYGVWSLRGLWSNVYVLHDRSRSEADRVAAAYALSRDPRVNQRQLWDMCLRKPLPELARYVLAEALTARAASDDPRAYALTVARSPDWPGWLRLLLTRPMAYASVEGVDFPRDALDSLSQSSDPAIALWAEFVAASGPSQDAGARRALGRACERPGPDRELACLLARARERQGDPPAQGRLLDEATVWLRSHHPEARRLWSGWAVEGGRLVPRPASKLQ